MTQRPTATLLVISGPVGVGKSTAALGAAAALRSAGVPAAALDLDEIYRMLRQREGYGEPEIWRHTRGAAAALAAYALREVAPVVIVEGGFYTPADLAELLGPLKPAPRVAVVTLHASYAEVSRRVLADPDPRRVASKVPATLALLYAEYEAAIPYLRSCGALIDVTSMSAGQVGAALAAIAAPLRV